MTYLNQPGLDLAKLWIGISVVCLLVGLIFWRWPDKVQKHDIRMALYIKNPENHKAFIKGVGYFLLIFSIVALLISIVNFFN